ncbi:nucleotide exchange factor GrpE [Candidatus Woesearchaeota archaeon]|nr:nucleotide exchange factor GrpE [Candidatus Woesearchaeota archaeon]
MTDKKKLSKDTEKGLEKSETSQKEKIKELTETLQRLQAEFENYKKRVDKEKAEFVKYSKHELIAKLLPILDSFKLAIKNGKNNPDFFKGIELIFSQFYSALEAEGLRPIEALGKKFDPYKHEVLMQETSDKEEDIVLEELQKGYMLNDKVLRHSKVKVSKKKEEKKK